MLDSIIKQTALALLVRGVGNEQAAKLFWDIKYLYLFGIPEIPNLIPNPELPPQPFPAPVIPFPPQPQPDPSPIDRLRINEDILFDLIDIFDEGFSSQSGIAGVLRNTEIRLKAANELYQRLNTAMEGLKKEIERLEKQL
jgi:hypothetical protein